MNEDELILIAACYCHNHHISTLPGFLRGAEYTLRARTSPPLPHGERSTTAFVGLKKYHSATATTRQAKAISIQDLQAIRSSLDLAHFDQSRDWFTYLLAFFGLLRISEFTGSNSLLWRHVTMGVDADTAKKFLQVTVPFSKTSSLPHSLFISEQGDALCPVAAFIRYHSAAGQHQRDSPLLLSAPGSNTGINRRSFVRQLRQRLTHIDGRDSSVYSGHSFRRGGTTALLLAGISSAAVQAHGRWRSEAWRKYFEYSQPINSSATAQLHRIRRQDNV